LVNATMKDIELLVLAGKPIYGERRFLDLLRAAHAEHVQHKEAQHECELPAGYTEITVGRRPMFVIGDPVSLYREIRHRVGFRKVLDFLPFDPDPQLEETKKPKKETT